jgi:alkylated DNA repair dioxygenase AlkB
MHVQMMCLGRHWNPLTYTYGPTRADRDDLPVGAVPDEWVDLASGAASAAGFSMRPDICLINFYEADGRMGLHQERRSKRERRSSRSLSAIRLDSFLAGCGGAIRSRRSSSSQEMRSCLAAWHAFAITACRESFRTRRQWRLVSQADST